MKTLDIQAKEWFDKINGNSYFSALITIDFGMDSEKSIKIPFQYGYDNQYLCASLNELRTLGFIDIDNFTPLYRYCNDKGIVFNSSKLNKCLKRDVVSWGK